MTRAEIIDRLEKGDTSNELDIAIEIATFDPPVSIRANAAGTKVIYTLRSGKEETCWAGDHSLFRRQASIAALRSLQDEEAR